MRDAPTTGHFAAMGLFAQYDADIAPAKAALDAAIDAETEAYNLVEAEARAVVASALGNPVENAFRFDGAGNNCGGDWIYTVYWPVIKVYEKVRLEAATIRDARALSGPLRVALQEAKDSAASRASRTQRQMGM